VSFSDDVRVEGLNSEAFELDADTTLAVRKLEMRDRRPLSFEEVSDQIRATLEREARAEAVEDRGLELLGELEAGASWSELVEDHALVASEFEGTRDDGSDPVSRELIQEIFKLARPGNSGAITGGFLDRAGNYVIYRLTEVSDADPELVDNARREAVRDLLRARQSNDLYAEFEKELRDEAEVTIYEEQF
jgi:peptidyl-prolyl cis-trans isomerase D